MKTTGTIQDLVKELKIHSELGKSIKKLPKLGLIKLNWVSVQYDFGLISWLSYYRKLKDLENKYEVKLTGFN